MKNSFCSLEQDVLKSLEQGKLNPEQKKHLKTCSVCQDSIMVKSWMEDFNEASLTDINLKHKIPDFELIWRGSRVYKKYDKELEKKVLLPLLFPKILTFIFALIGIVVILTTSTDKIKDFVSVKLKMGYLFDLLGLVGKSMLAMMPFLVIPIVVVASFIAFYFVFALFKPKKIPEQ